VVLDKLDSILPSVLKNGLLDKLQTKKVVSDVKDDTLSNEAGVHLLYITHLIKNRSRTI
jgi:hypothetical protein